MKTAHQFIFTPGEWVGEGKITFSTSPDMLRFYTKWIVEAMDDGKISCKQQVEMEGRKEHVYNNFIFSSFEADKFIVQISSDFLGCMPGKGIVDETKLAWEFRGNPEFEGFEVYELENNGNYTLHAEYLSSEQYRTIIDGRIWKKTL